MMHDLVTLRLFVRGAETGKLAEAAQQCHLAPAAASRRIALLEDRLGVQLFYRGRHGVTLTPAGEALLARARDLLDQARALDAEMADYAGGLKGQVRVLANTSAITQALPSDLADYARAAPDVRIALEEAWSAEVVAAVQADRADLGVIVEGVDAPGLELTPYRPDRLALLAPTGFFAREGFGSDAPLAFADVLDHDFVGLLEATAITRRMQREAAAAERPLRLRIQVRSFDGVFRMVEAGFGLGVLPETAARWFAASSSVEVRGLTDSWAMRRMMMLCHAPGARRAGLVRGLVAHLVRRAAEAID